MGGLRGREGPQTRSFGSDGLAHLALARLGAHLELPEGQRADDGHATGDAAVDKIRYRSSGRESAREVVVKDDFVVAIPMLADGRLVLVNQFRHPFAAPSAAPAATAPSGGQRSPSLESAKKRS